jgi:hypothetical protein
MATRQPTIQISKFYQPWNRREKHLNIFMHVLSRAINFGRQCHFKIWLDYHTFKNYAHVNKVSKN